MLAAPNVEALFIERSALSAIFAAIPLSCVIQQHEMSPNGTEGSKTSHGASGPASVPSLPDLPQGLDPETAQKLPNQKIASYRRRSGL